MPSVRNPILPGFNPDPSILRVGKDYYIATSTFEWYPGVQIYHSTDLANWTLVTRPLSRESQLDLRGEPDSCGVWAPCLTYDGDEFWLVYTDVKRKAGSFKDTHNYIIHASSIGGPWSDPIYTNSSGFDPSLFHDDDGRKWFVNMLTDHRSRPEPFAGICLQEFDYEKSRLIGPRKNVYKGTDVRITEAPHMYKRNGWYYILIAEGGTGYSHACTLARSRDIWGPYKTHPDKHILTSKDTPFAALQKAGHGDIVEALDGKVYLVHLTERKYTFEKGLPQDFQWLRTPKPDRLFSFRDDKLVLHGRESIGSWYEHSLVARRQEHFSYEAETVIDFSPEDERQLAGLTAYYNRYCFFYLAVTTDSDGQRELLIMTSEQSYPRSYLKEPFVDPVQIPNEGKVKLALAIHGGQQLQFFYALKGQDLVKVGPIFDASIMSDECGGQDSLTGAFAGVACSDLNGLGKKAIFDYFIYRPIEHKYDRYEIKS
ncbi:putative beta-xylosidase [Fusarium proliferatum ET1]|uniref:Probable beta-xylosidase n=1 Tax=Fusarium proliferatum (strain ET1) TaxID=1227346 RepID=A0A1L7WB38_FUSPR|nr:putative beta-xylosidase [Fusarium proliferatum ET1]CZR49802.1 probable beta-xylosidase [Fusarium proliferatum ET1]